MRIKMTQVSLQFWAALITAIPFNLNSFYLVTTEDPDQTVQVYSANSSK